MNKIAVFLICIPLFAHAQSEAQNEFNQKYTAELIGKSFIITWHSGYLLYGSPNEEISEHNGLMYPIIDRLGIEMNLEFQEEYCIFRWEIYSWEIYDGYFDEKNNRLNLNIKMVNEAGKEADTLLLFDYGADTLSFTIFDNIQEDIYFFDFLLLEER